MAREKAPEVEPKEVEETAPAPVREFTQKELMDALAPAEG